MTNLREMKVDELKDIARKYAFPGIWKMTKDQLIENILKHAGLNGQENEYFDGAAEEETAEPEETAEENLEDENLEDEEPEENLEDENLEDEEPTVKKPSLGIKEIEFNGKTQSLKAWAEELEMPWPTLYDRINRNGWTIEEALTIPLGGRRKKRA